MPEPKEKNGLQVDQDMDFQEKEWKAERIGWVVLLLFLLAALAGLFGSGPLSEATVNDGTMRVDYPRFARYRSPHEVTVQVDSAQASDGKLQVWVGRDYLSQIELEKIVPEPDQVQLHPDRVVYEFQVPEPGQPVTITFQYKPEGIGMQTGPLGLENSGQQVTFSQFVYP